VKQAKRPGPPEELPDAKVLCADEVIEETSITGSRSGPHQIPVDLLPAGALFDGNYRVVRQLGGGAMGVVVLARDERLERDVALKLIRPDLGSLVADSRERFLAEARAMARVRHANVVAVHAFGEVDGSPYMVMDYVPGTSLDQWLKPRGDRPLRVDEAVGILDQICRGVAAIHASGTAHRDLKPGNILVGPAFRMVVADLGLARVFAELQGTLPHGRSGTPAYMAPEVLEQHSLVVEHSPLADVYSLGVIAHQLLTGTLPTKSDATAKDGDMTGASVPMVLSPSLPAAFEPVLAGALCRTPSERTRSADAFRRGLVAAAEKEHVAHGAIRILIADDDLDVRELITILLRKAFPLAEIECVADGQAAVEAASRHLPGLAVFDLDMPRMSGAEAVARLRADPATKSIPVIIATAVGGSTDWGLLVRLAADGFLGKPFEASQLITLARSIIPGTAPDAAR
jgi:serine/threonine-protein kinase